MRTLSTHAEWLRLVEVSGPFLSTTMLERAFPQGLEAIDTPRRQRLRSAYEEWRDAVDENDPQLAELHREWVMLVLNDILEYDPEMLTGPNDFGSTYVCRAPECAVTFIPDLAVKISDDQRPRLFISIQPPGTDLEKVQLNDSWPVPLVDRMSILCRTTGVRLGLVTNGERWMLVNAPIDSTSSHTSWYSRFWFQEPVTLRAFLSLLGVRRCFGPLDQTLDSLLEESLMHHEELTDSLGEQVRRAVEVLVQCLDKADLDRNRELLHDVSPSELYEAGLTIMMRLVFVLCAEERGLLHLDDPVYDQSYAIFTLRSQLAEDADLYGPEVLDRRHDAWARLLAVFRAIYGGIDHESLRMPALGGSLFNPDRFPFLEGRAKGTKWRATAAIPLPIDNRTVLLLLEALQVLEQPGGALLLSYKALDVENIGHVYEGLLEHTVVRVPEVTLGLVGSQNAKNLNVSLCELEAARAISERALTDLLLEKTKRSELAIRKALTKPIDEALSGRVLTVCGGDAELTRRIIPFANQLRTDAWGDPIVYRAHSFMVAIGTDRRETGAHYTPKPLTETVVASTLEPLAFFGPAEGRPREEWLLKSPTALLDLKICDIAMGSGAFLVQACRRLAEYLVEAWIKVERGGKFLTVDGEIVACLESDEPMPANMDERLIIARRLVAERCLYGVDLNPLAVELAKLSIWLITMDKGRPFGFLDHNLRCGDSLMGIHRLKQLTHFNMKPETGQRQLRIFGQSIEVVLKDVIKLRKRLRTTPIRDIRDVEVMAQLDLEARTKLESVELIADGIIGESLRFACNAKGLETALDSLAILSEDFLNGNERRGTQIFTNARKALAIDLPDGKPPRKPFHWALEFPEVFEAGRGFDGIIGNPPFMGGQKITGNLGNAYREYLVKFIAHDKKGSADLCAYFLLIANLLLNEKKVQGFVISSTISEGDTRDVGLEQLLLAGNTIINAITKIVWPGKANVTIIMLCIYKGAWEGSILLNKEQSGSIDSTLFENNSESKHPYKLYSNKKQSYQGSIPLGKGFVLNQEEVEGVLKINNRCSEVIYGYLTGQELNIDPKHKPSQWIINFQDWPLDMLQAPQGYKGPVASDYPECLEIVAQKVKPERDKVNRKIRRERWWQYAERAKGLYLAIQDKEWSLAIATQATKYVAFGQVHGRNVYSNAIAIIASDDYFLAACLSSSIHEVWARRYASYNLFLLRYSPTDLFETFPLPKLMTSKVRTAGGIFFEERSRVMCVLNEGLTEIYNRLHNPAEVLEIIVDLRKLLVSMDYAVAEAYNWLHLELAHDFYDTAQGVRYTISAQARTIVLSQLLEMNHERHEEEVKQGLQENITTHTPSATLSTRINTGDADQCGFDFESFDASNPIAISTSTDCTRAILDFLLAHPSWHAKGEILAATKTHDGQWSAAIKDLLNCGLVERQGEKRGVRYKANTQK